MGTEANSHHNEALRSEDKESQFAIHPRIPIVSTPPFIQAVQTDASTQDVIALVVNTLRTSLRARTLLT